MDRVEVIPGPPAKGKTKPPLRALAVVIPVALDAELRALARETDRPLSRVVREALVAGLNAGRRPA